MSLFRLRFSFPFRYATYLIFLFAPVAGIEPALPTGL